MWVAFANAKATHIFFSKNISVYAIYANSIISFEQLGPDWPKYIFANKPILAKHENDNRHEN